MMGAGDEIASRIITRPGNNPAGRRILLVLVMLGRSWFGVGSVPESDRPNFFSLTQLVRSAGFTLRLVQPADFGLQLLDFSDQLFDAGIGRRRGTGVWQADAVGFELEDQPLAEEVLPEVAVDAEFVI